MALIFDQDDYRHVSGGVDKVALYVGTAKSGYAWNGVSEVGINPSGGDVNTIWADNIVYAKVRGNESFAGSIKAYMYPQEWKQCIGIKDATGYVGVQMAEQTHEPFNLCYREKTFDKDGKWIYSTYHVLFGLSAGVSEKTAKTLEEGFEPEEFSFDFEGTPAQLGNTGKFACEYTFTVPCNDDGVEITTATASSASITRGDKTWAAAEQQKVIGYLAKLYTGTTVACLNPATVFAQS